MPVLVIEVDQTTANSTTYIAPEASDASDFADDLQINALVTVSVLAGDLTLQAGDDIILQSDALATASGHVIVTAGFGDLDGGGAIISQGLIHAVAGNVDIDAIGDIRPGQVVAGAAALLTSTTGAIVDNNAIGADITAAALALIAATGIGTGTLPDPLETAVDSLEASTATGGIFLTNTAANLLIGGVDAAIGGIQVSTSGNIFLFNTGNIILAGATNEDIQTASGNVTVEATGDVEVRNSSSGAIDSDNGNVTIIAGQDILLGSPALDQFGDIEANGNLILSATRDVIVDEATFVTALGTGTMTVTAGRNISILQTDGSGGAHLNTQGGDITLTTGADGLLTVDSNSGSGTINTTQSGGNGNITINADRVNLTAGDIVQTGTGVVSIAPVSAGWAINLGSLADATPTTLELSDAELDQIFAGTLRIGSATAGAVTVSDTIDLANIATLSLQSAGLISNLGPLIDETNLALRGGAVSLSVDVDTLAGTAAADFVVADLDGLTIGTVDGVNGISTSNGLIQVETTNLTVSAAVNAGNSLAFLNATFGSHLLTNQSSISGGFIQLKGDAIDLQPGSSVTSNGIVVLTANSLGVSADLGSAGAGFAFSQAELDTITAAAVHIDPSFNVNISENVTLDPAKVPVLLLSASSGAITDGTATETAQITATGLALLAGTGIGAADDLDIAVSTLAFLNVSGAVNITNSGALTLGAVAGQDSSSNTGTTTTITATSPLTVAADLLSVGTATLTASESVGAGDDLTINAGVTVSVLAGGLTLQAGDDIILDSGAQALASGNVTVTAGFGDLDGAGEIISQGVIQGDIVDIDAIGDIRPGRVGGTLASLTSTTGAIVDNNITGVDIIAFDLALAAATGIGTLADPLETQVDSLEARTATGGIFLSNTAANLLIGGVDASLAGIEVTTSGNISLFNTGNIILAGDSFEDIRTASGNVTVQATGNVEVRNISTDAIASDNGNVTVIAGQDILLGSAVTDSFGDVKANGDVILSAGRDVIVDENTFVSAFGTGTVTVNAVRNISLLASDGSASANLNTQGGDITLTTGADGLLTVDSNNIFSGTISAIGAGGNGNITINADRVNITAGDTVEAGTGIVSIAPVSAGWAIHLGSDTDGAPTTLELSDAELDRIFAGTLRIGSATTGVIVVADTIDLANISTLSLQSGVFISGDRIEETNLALRGGGVNLRIDVDTLAGQSTGAGGQFVIAETDDLTIGTVDGVSGVSTDNGVISVIATNLTVSAAVNGGTNDVFLGAFGFGSGLLTNQSSISGGAVTLRADAIDLQPGSSVAATGLVHLRPDLLGIIADVGSAGAGLAFSQAELDTVTAAVLRIVGTFGVNISQNVAFDPAKVPVVWLDASLGAITDGTVTETAQITATGLKLTAGDGGIGFGDDLDIAVSTLAFVNFNGAVNITNSGPLVLGAVADLASSSNTNGTTTITATSPLTVAADMISGGTATLTATDSAAAGDNLTINAGVVVQSFTGNVVLQAGDDFNLAAGANLVAAGTISIALDFGNADAGVGGTAILNGTLSASAVQISGNSDNDTVTTALSVLANLTIDGLDGNDRIGGGGGNDLLIGGAGIDTAVFHGSRADYLIEALGGGSLRVTDLRPGAPDGIDILHGIENLDFADHPVTDFNGDGHSDILWQNDNGQPGIWLMDGFVPIADGGVGFNPGPTWNAKGAGDFNGDGHADILWQNDNGQAGVWLMDGLSVIADSGVGFNPGPTWNVIDAGDFNGDGHADILWQNDNGQAGVWLMDGFNVIADGGVGFNPGPTWDVKASGDFNGDGMADILWQNDNGQAGIWLMDGLSVIADSGVGFNPGPSWNVIDAGDFNGDGKADILWQNDNGQAGIWLMDGFNVIADGGVGFNPGPTWDVEAAGDYNGDGKSDILWQNDNGQAGVWLMDGLTVLSDSGVGFNPGPTWHVVGQNHELI